MIVLAYLQLLLVTWFGRTSTIVQDTERETVRELGWFCAWTTRLPGMKPGYCVSLQYRDRTWYMMYPNWVPRRGLSFCGPRDRW